MAKRRPQSVEDMEIQAIKDHLSRQDKMWAEEKEKAKETNKRFYDLISEINTILGGSASLGVPGMRQDVKELKLDVNKLKQSDSMRGKWLLNFSSIPGAIVTLIMVIGGILGIIGTIKDLTKKEPKTEQPQETQKPIQPQSFLREKTYQFAVEQLPKLHST